MAADKPLSGLSILLVEDDADSRDLLSLVFLNAAATVTTASNATDGYALYTASPPAVVVTDIAMPHRDGFWLFNAIRSMPGSTPPPVVAVTALAMPKEREAILAAGFAAYLVKPLDPDEVIAVVGRCVGRG
jgi:CheY-like chemotaxis protein